jgi:cation diffusion facilitator family transporter
MPSHRAVYAAIGANVVVATAKFIAAAFTGSSSMFAEGIHSTVDAGNNGLLLVGRRARRRQPDETHPFGYGKDEYFWTLIVAMVIFAIGGGVSAYEGVSRLLEPGSIDSPYWSYGVLLVALLADGYSLYTAYREIRANRDEPNIFHAVRGSKDPSAYAVFFEDTAAVLGVVFAFAGLLLSQLLGNTYPDGIASLLIGLIMACTAVLLMYESKKLLIGETADSDLVAGIRRIAETDEAVAHCGPPLTMHMGPQDVLLNLDVQFKEDLSADEIFGAIDRLEDAIRDRFKLVRRIFIEAERLRHPDGRPAESSRSADGRAEQEAESCPAERTPADY